MRHHLPRDVPLTSEPGPAGKGRRSVMTNRETDKAFFRLALWPKVGTRLSVSVVGSMAPAQDRVRNPRSSFPISRRSGDLVKIGAHWNQARRPSARRTPKLLQVVQMVPPAGLSTM